ncbi:MAG: RING finger protein [Oscillospiraceae bacterium]
MNYKHNHCPVCEQEFKKEDTVVVCPTCGAPYHLECYEQKGVCIFKDKHIDGFDWKKEVSPEKSNPPPQYTCPKCKTKNHTDGLFCHVCGEKLNQVRDIKTAPKIAPIAANPFTTPYGGLSADEEICGVSVREIALFVGENSFSFIPKFKAIENGNKWAGFNFPAAFFNFFYFFYRKMYLLGFLTVLASLLFFIPFILIQVDVMQIIIQNPEILSSVNSTKEIAAKLSENSLALYPVSYIFNTLYTFFTLILAFFTNKFYLKHTIKKIKQIRPQYTDYLSDEYALALTKKGRTQKKLILTLLLLIIAIDFISLFLLK